jgi:hypothetical protein
MHEKKCALPFRPERRSFPRHSGKGGSASNAQFFHPDHLLPGEKGPDGYSCMISKAAATLRPSDSKML